MYAVCKTNIYIDVNWLSRFNWNSIANSVVALWTESVDRDLITSAEINSWRNAWEFDPGCRLIHEIFLRTKSASQNDGDCLVCCCCSSTCVVGKVRNKDDGYMRICLAITGTLSSPMFSSSFSVLMPSQRERRARRPSFIQITVSRTI